MSSTLTDDVRAALTATGGSRVVLTVGNSFRTDDGVGPYVAARLRARGSGEVVDAGHTPENVVDDVILRRPKRVIVIDAANFGGSTGEIRLIPEAALPETTLSTHRVPMNIITRLIQESTGAEIVYVGVQGRSFHLGERLTPAVRKGADRLVELLSPPGSAGPTGDACAHPGNNQSLLQQESIAMHEMHVVKDLFYDLLDHADENRVSQVTKVYVRMGEFTEINEEILRHYFEQHGRGTRVEGAVLQIEKSPTRELRLVSFDAE